MVCAVDAISFHGFAVARYLAWDADEDKSGEGEGGTEFRNRDSLFSFASEESITSGPLQRAMSLTSLLLAGVAPASSKTASE